MEKYIIDDDIAAKDFLEYIQNKNISIQNNIVFVENMEVEILPEYSHIISDLKDKDLFSNDLVFGKNKTQRITNISIKDNKAYIYSSNGDCKIKDYKPWVLTSKKYYGSVKLKGEQYYKYINYITCGKYNELKKQWNKNVWLPRSLEESFMLKTGYTHYKGMMLNEISVLSFDIEATSLNPQDKNAEVILISNTFRDNNGNITKKLFDIYNYNNSREMLLDWEKFVKKINPDILIGHNILGYDLPYINYQNNIRIGRDNSCIEFDEKESKFRKDATQQYSYYNAKIHGRDIIDTLFLSIKYDIGRNFPSYGLKAIEKYLKLVDDSRIEWDFKKYPTKDYKNWPENKWEEFKQYCKDDGDGPLKMFDIMIPPFFYLAQSVPKTLQQIINEASGSQLDCLMIRSYLQEGYSQPKTSQKTEFEGAISMGVPGIYKNVRKVDVASLYPSIMLEYNIYDKNKDPERHMLNMLEYFRNQRLENKKLAKQTGEKYYDDMQASQKILINSLYGFMGTGYLLYNYPKGAAEVTRKGREILLKGVEWATGHTLKRVVKEIQNKGKENEKIKYHWIVGDQVQDGRGYKLVNVDTDSFSVTNGIKPTDDEFQKEIDELNFIYPKLIKWEADGIFNKFIVIKAKNYIMDEVGKDKIKYKGSSLTDQKKEPALIHMLEDIIKCLLDNDISSINDVYIRYCKEALNPKNIRDWCVKKTITKPVLNPERSNEQKVLDACNEAIEKEIISDIQEGDKIWVYQAIDGKKQKIVKGELVFLKDGTPKMIENTILKFPELYNNDHDKWHYVKRVYMTLNILENIIDIDSYIKYHNKTKRKLLLTDDN